MNRIGPLLRLAGVALIAVALAACNRPQGYFQSAYDKHMKGDYDGAIADYTKIIGMDPTNADAYAYRGLEKRVKGDLDGAIADFNKAIDLKPDESFAYGNRGLAKEAKGDLEGALADCTTAIGFDPTSTAAYESRAYLERTKGDMDAAAADYSQAISMEPTNLYSYSGRAEILIKKGESAAAMADLQRIIQLAPTNDWAYASYGYLLYDARSFQDSLANFHKAVEFNPTNTYARFRVWLIRARNGETGAASDELVGYIRGQKTDEWGSKVGSFLAGKVTEADLLEAAKSSDLKREKEQYCEAYFYAGSKRLFAGDKTGAAELFQKSVDTGVKNFTEYGSSVMELKELSNNSGL